MTQLKRICCVFNLFVMFRLKALQDRHDTHEGNCDTYERRLQQLQIESHVSVAAEGTTATAIIRDSNACRASLERWPTDPSTLEMPNDAPSGLAGVCRAL
eukprot:GHVU01209333.1.p1 GENE.GHVU01209333.1~~GHVU01209333.1.p1  ORF type:complete len:100 (+),score=9.17 GHVU01209333.1:639-938(+)